MSEKEKTHSNSDKLTATTKDSLYNYRLDIDGLRGLAVLAVLIFHADSARLPSGFRGVDVFFIISGYVVTASILRHQSKNFLEYLANFYKRRILRLMPALLACILTTTIVGSLFIKPDAFAPALAVGGRSLIGWSNNYLIATGSDYFSLSTDLNPFTHTWSLGVEEQFYFVFPILLAFTYGLRRPLQNKRIAVLVLGALVIASSLFSLHLTHTNPLKAYYFMPGRFWEMASGALLFATLIAWPNLLKTLQQQRWLSYATQLGAILLLGIAFTFATPEQGIPIFLGTVITTIGTLLFVIAGLSQNSLLSRAVAKPVWTYLGKISYSLYLWHWPVFVLFRWLVGMGSMTKVLAAMGITFGLALGSYYLIEQPVRKMKALHYKRVFAVALASILIVGGNNVAVAKATVDGNLYLYKEYNKTDWTADADSILIEGSQVSYGNCEINKEEFDSTTLAEKLKACTSPARKQGSPHLFVIGDSHAQSTIPMLDEIAKETDMGITILSSAGCFISTEMALSNDTYQNCPQIVSGVLNLVEENAQAGDILLNVSRYALLNTHQLIGQHEPKRSIIQSNHPEEILSKEDVHLKIKSEITKLSNRLERKGIHLVVQAPLPEHHANAAQCLPTWFSAGSGLKPNCFTPKALVLKKRQAFMDVLKEIQQNSDNLYVWDTFDELCPDTVCSHFKAGKPLFYDDDHLSVYGSKSLSSNFLSFLKTHSLT